MRNSLLKPDSAKKNFAFQFIYQIVILVIPLVVSPYLTRTMGGTALGIYAYTYSIAYYFVVIAMLGIRTHGQRIISRRRGNITALRKTFWSLLTVHVMISVMALIAYIIYVFVICGADENVAFAQTIYVASALFDLTWLFYGLEKFKTVTIRNAIIKIITTVCIFAFVHSPEDVVLYTIIMAASTCAGHIVLFPHVLAEIPFIKFKKEDLKEHIKPLFVLFAGTIAISLYTVFDKTLLGVMLSKVSVAYYEYSDKIINIPKTFIAIVSIVLYPKACQYAMDNDIKKMQITMEKATAVTCLIGFSTCFGLVAIADQFALLYYGEEFAVCGEIISMMSPLILILGIGDTVRRIYIFPMKMDSIIVKILFLNAGVNLVLSVSLIPFLGIAGAVAGTIAAETTGLVIEIFLVRKYVSIKWLLLQYVPYGIIGAIMFAVVRVVAPLVEAGWGSLVIQILTGVVVYGIGVVVYMHFFKRNLLNMGVNEIKKRLRSIKK